MTVQLSKELITALHSAGTGTLEVVDPATNRIYVIVDEATHRQALRALRAQQDREAIAEGIAQMEAGEGRPAKEAFEDMRSRLGFPPEE